MNRKTIKTEKTFDCIAFKGRVQAGIYEATKGMSFEEETAYLEHRAEQGALGT